MVTWRNLLAVAMLVWSAMLAFAIVEALWR